MMKNIQGVTLIVIATIVITMCGVDVMLGGDPRMANLEALTKDLRNLALRAQDYYRRPQSKGGGGGTFTGLTADAAGIRKLTFKDINANGTYFIAVAGSATSVTIHGVGTQIANDGVLVSADIKVMADSAYVSYP